MARRSPARRPKPTKCRPATFPPTCSARSRDKRRRLGNEALSNLPTSPPPDPNRALRRSRSSRRSFRLLRRASSDGSSVFYEQQGRIFAFGTASATATPIASGGEARIVFVSPDGSRVYFASTALVGGEGTPGAPNLYAWHEAKCASWRPGSERFRQLRRPRIGQHGEMAQCGGSAAERRERPRQRASPLDL